MFIILLRYSKMAICPFEFAVCFLKISWQHVAYCVYFCVWVIYEKVPIDVGAFRDLFHRRKNKSKSVRLGGRLGLGRRDAFSGRTRCNSSISDSDWLAGTTCAHISIQLDTALFPNIQLTPIQQLCTLFTIVLLSTARKFHFCFYQSY